MTASALNTASMSTPAAGQAGAANGAVAGAGAVAGFDALLAALFPADGGVPANADANPQGATAAIATPEAGEDVKDAATDGAPPAESADAAAADATADAAATALAATLAGQQPLAPPPAQTTTPTDSAAHAAPAWGRDKAKGAPAAPALAHANPKADLADKAGLVPDGVDEAPAPPSQVATNANPPAAPRGPTSAAGRAALPPAIAANTPAPADNVADAPPPPPPATETETAPDVVSQQAAVAGAGQAAAKAEAPAAQPLRPTRSERTRGGSESDAASALNPTQAADKPVHAKAVDAAAKPAAASAEAKAAPEVPEIEGKAAPATTEAAPPADAKSAIQASGAAAHTAQAVRGSPETVANLAAQIVKKLEGQSTRFDLELNPNGLGKVDVRIEIGAQGQLSAAMLFDNAQAAQELKSRATELQRALEQAGFNLSGGLTFDVADQGRQQGQAWQDQAEAGHAFRGQAFRAALETAGDADVATQGALRLRRGVNAGLDVRI